MSGNGRLRTEVPKKTAGPFLSLRSGLWASYRPVVDRRENHSGRVVLSQVGRGLITLSTRDRMIAVYVSCDTAGGLRVIL